MFRGTNKPDLVLYRWQGQWGGCEHCAAWQGDQCSAVEQTKASVHNFVAAASEPEAANRHKSATGDVNIFRRDSMCRR